MALGTPEPQPGALAVTTYDQPCVKLDRAELPRCIVQTDSDAHGNDSCGAALAKQRLVDRITRAGASSSKRARRPDESKCVERNRATPTAMFKGSRARKGCAAAGWARWFWDHSQRLSAYMDHQGQQNAARLTYGAPTSIFICTTNLLWTALNATRAAADRVPAMTATQRRQMFTIGTGRRYSA
jgi:hypothetical protein